MRRFIHVPKTGGTAATKWLQQNKIDFIVGKQPKGVGKHRTVSSFIEETIPRFCIVRNPYARIVSYYNYISAVEGWGSFKYFILNKVPNTKFNIPSPWKLQSDWVFYNGQCCIDTIFRCESLESELQNFFNCQVAITKENTSSKIVTLTDLTGDLKQIVSDHFREDFKNFNYPI